MFALPHLLPFVLPLVLGTAPFHPHNPKALILQGAAGKATVTYFTIPFNPEHLADLPSGFEWHLGYAALETEVPLQGGDVKIPPARYKLSVMRGDTNDEWSLLLEPFDVWGAKMSMRRGGQRAERARERLLQMLEDLKEKGIPERIVIPTQGVEAPEAEHLELTVLFAGYDATERYGTDPASGMHMKLHMDFGTLHREVALSEAFQKKDD